MRLVGHLFLAASTLLGLTSTVGAQLYNFPPEIDRIGGTNAAEPGRVAIIGEHLSLVNRVTIDGVVTPILRQSGTRITIQPVGAAPGYHVVEVRNPFGTAAGVLELLPIVSGDRIGNLMNVRIANGAAGTCTLFYSTEFLDVPDTLPGVGYARLLDLESVLSGGVFSVTIFVDHPIEVHKFKIPKDVGITGIPFFVQGLCEQGFPAEGSTTSSFTNVGIIPGLPGNGHHE